MSSPLSPTQIAAFQLALRHTEPGVIFIDDIPDEPTQALVANLQERMGTASVRAVAFVAAKDISDPNLQRAINRADFSKQRLVAQRGDCYTFDIAELQKYLDSLE
ncbi:hypothetical protein H6G00_01620 [Leptolyngbya sp. FACHB-541]|uniref:hypothetical protein n=1 Tax=Leptolyngbya sp. FACHB-541 TaxID=2692810 RepID=UPI0016857AC9|nr:hypothetical protein [Leptolyngbya sp. FACHB-541]MBD1995329.1 hypothetical protein [Leptolyngbya sp. FACHB-541]